MSDTPKQGPFSRKKLTPFLAHQMLYDYAAGLLEPERRAALEEFIEKDNESQQILKNLELAQAWARRLSEVKVDPVIISQLEEAESAMSLGKRYSSWREWPESLRWSITAIGLSAVVASLVVLIPWSKLSTSSRTASNGTETVEIAQIPQLKGDEPTEVAANEDNGSGDEPPDENVADDGSGDDGGSGDEAGDEGATPKKAHVMTASEVAAAKKAAADEQAENARVQNEIAKLASSDKSATGAGAPGAAAVSAAATSGPAAAGPATADAGTNANRNAVMASPHAAYTPEYLVRNLPLALVNAVLPGPIVASFTAPKATPAPDKTAQAIAGEANSGATKSNDQSPAKSGDKLGGLENANQTPPGANPNTNPNTNAVAANGAAMAANTKTGDTGASAKGVKAAGSNATGSNASSRVTMSETPDTHAAGDTKARGFVYRAFMTLDNLEELGPKIKDDIVSLGGEKAGEVELGWKRGTGRYYHFALPEDAEKKILERLQVYGPVRISKDPHPRVMPAGKVRFILWVESASEPSSSPDGSETNQ